MPEITLLQAFLGLFFLFGVSVAWSGVRDWLRGKE